MKIQIANTFIESSEKIFNPSIFRRISNLVNNIKWSVKNYIKYRKIISKSRPWDYIYIIEMMKFQLSELCNTIEKYGNEVDESRLPKVKNMKRAIELLNNQIEDNYTERCGYDENAIKMFVEENEIKFEKNEGYENYDDEKIFKDSCKLEEKEWNELFEILKDMRRWWD